jgi:hypothetical protein
MSCRLSNTMTEKELQMPPAPLTIEDIMVKVPV